MYYRPLLPNGKEVQLPWQIKLFMFSFSWPLKDDATLLQRSLDKFGVILGLLMFLHVDLAEMTFFLKHLDDIGVALESLVSTIVAFELTVRIYWISFRKQQFREFIKEFYSKIYVEKSSNSKMYSRIHRNLGLSVIHSYFYIGTLSIYFIKPIMGFIHNVHLLPFPMSFVYDYTPWPIYIPTLISSVWVGVSIVASLIDQSYFLVTVILHLNARYLLLKDEVNRLSGDLLKSSSDVEHLAARFNERLVQLIKKNLELQQFSKLFEKQYTFHIFTTLSLSAIVLCILAFEVLRVDSANGNAQFVFWICAKIMELIVLGRLGSLLFSTILKGAGSYFTFICSLR